MAGSSKAGGAAMAGGERFQARVAAWYAARILLQTPAIGQEFDLPATSIADYWFCWLRNNDPSRADQLLRNLLRETRSLNSTKLRSHCGEWLATLWFSQGEVWAEDTLISAIASIRDNTDELEGALRATVNELLPRPPKEPILAEQRQRALDFLVRLLSEANQAIQTYSAELAAVPLSERPNEVPAWGSQGYSIV